MDIEKLVRLVSEVVDKKLQRFESDLVEAIAAKVTNDVKTELIRELVVSSSDDVNEEPQDATVKKALQSQNYQKTREDLQRHIGRGDNGEEEEEYVDPDAEPEENYSRMLESIRERAEKGDVPPSPDAMQRQVQTQQGEEAFGDNDPAKRDYKDLVSRFS